ncbi:MAG: single-strand binding protein family [Caudoviricetes sp.]|nr:MAG: single-strand binding protein family [Caudoviricetes sp.]
MNKVFLIGNLTRDPELTETSSGTAICRFSIAVSRNYKNSDGEYDTDFFNCQAWRGIAESIARYVRKGNKVAVTGILQNRSYEDSKGDKKTVTEIQVQDIEFLTPKPSESKSDAGRGKAQKPALQAFDDDSDIPF